MLDLHNPTPADLQPFFPELEIRAVLFSGTNEFGHTTAVVETSQVPVFLWIASDGSKGFRSFSPLYRYTPQPKRGWFRRLIDWMTK